MRKIFLVGGAGYVGSVLTLMLLKKNYKVTVFDLMIYGDNIDDHPNLKKIKGDIRNLDLLEKSVTGHEIVIHLACISNDPSFELNPQLGKSINFDPFEPFVKICRKKGVDKFIYASSSSVYGVKKEKNVVEDMSLEPLTDYSKFKAMCEKILEKYSSDTFTTISTRPATVCGYSPRQRLDLIINILTNLAYNNRKIKIFGGSQLRPNIHIFDMSNSYISLIEAPNKLVNKQSFNIGYENYSVENLASIVKKVIGDDVEMERLETDDIRSYHVSSNKISELIHFKPQKTLENAVEDLHEAFKKQLFKDPLSNEEYYNIKKMNNINLK